MRPVTTLRCGLVAAVVMLGGCNSGGSDTTATDSSTIASSGNTSATVTSTAARSGGTTTGSFRSSDGYDYSATIEILPATQSESDVPRGQYGRCSTTPAPNKFIVPMHIKLGNNMNQSIRGGSIGTAVVTRRGADWEIVPDVMVNYEANYACDQAGNGKLLANGPTGSLSAGKYFDYPGSVMRSFTRAELSDWGLIVVTPAAPGPVAGITLDGTPITGTNLSRAGTTTTTRPKVSLTQEGLLEHLRASRPDLVTYVEQAISGQGQAPLTGGQLTIGPNPANGGGIVIYFGGPVTLSSMPSAKTLTTDLCEAIAGYTWPLDHRYSVIVQFNTASRSELINSGTEPECYTAAY